MKMEYKEEKKGKMIFVGVGVDTSVQNAPKDCPEVWNKFMQRYKEIENYKGGMKNYGISLTKSNQNCTFRYVACAEVSEISNIPEGMEKVETTESNHLIFEHKGKLDKIGETYGKIMEFLPTTDKKQNEDFWIEFYDYRWKGDKEESIFEIWVPVIN
jgi:AraC family transcriptional regulator